MHEYREDMGTCDECGQPPEQHAAYLTPGELADLRVIRGRAMMDRGDIEPMRRVSYAASPGRYDRAERVIPWLEALNMEVD